MRTLPLAVLALFAGSALAQSSITEIPVLAGTQQSIAHAVSADGQVVVGVCGQGLTPDIITSPAPIMWTVATGTQRVPGTSTQPDPTGYAYSVNSNGAFIAGRLGPNNPYRWSAPSTITNIPPLPSVTQTIALAISRDGSAVVGQSLNSPTKPYVWYAAVGTVPLPGGENGGTARGVNANGAVVVGSVPGNAARWLGTSSGSIFVFAPNGAAYAVNFQGNIIVGHITPPGGFGHATRWEFPSIDSTDYVETDLGVVPGPSPEIRRSLAQAVTDDGATVVGWSTRYDAVLPSTSWPRAAFLWRSDLGMVNLNDHAAAQGVNLTGWELRSANGISADGTTIVGTALHDGLPRAYILRLAPGCHTADVNGDGDVGTDADIEFFFLCIAGACPCQGFGCGPADFNRDGDVGTDADIEAFFRVLAGGNC